MDLDASYKSESLLYNSLRKLQLMALSVETLKVRIQFYSTSIQETAIGKSVNLLRKHSSKDVRDIAKTLIESWKNMVDEWVMATKETVVVSEATPESINPSVLDEEEEGLISPPLDDLAFFYPHASLELSDQVHSGQPFLWQLRSCYSIPVAICAVCFQCGYWK